MQQAYFSFAPELQLFLEPVLQGLEIPVPFEDAPAVKHMIESLGVPHTEVGALCVNGVREDLTYHLKEADRVEVCGCLPGQDVPVDIRFVLDNHLGRLAAYLRMLGFDSLYRNDYADPELAQLSAVEDRILLSRDRRLLMRKIVRYGYCPRSMDPHTQLAEVLERFGLSARIDPFSRCLRCNGLLQPVSKEAVMHRLEPLTKQYYDEFAICPDCKQVYWQGSHHEHMQGWIAGLVSDGGKKV